MNRQETSPWAIVPYLVPGIKAHAGRLFWATACMFGGVALRLIEPWPLQIVLDNVLAGLPAPATLNTGPCGARTSCIPPCQLLF